MSVGRLVVLVRGWDDSPRHTCVLKLQMLQHLQPRYHGEEDEGRFFDESKLKKHMFQACGMSSLEAYMERNDMSRLEARKHQPRATGKAGPTMTSVTELCAKVTSQLSLPKIATRGVSLSHPLMEGSSREPAARYRKYGQGCKVL